MFGFYYENGARKAAVLPTNSGWNVWGPHIEHGAHVVAATTSKRCPFSRSMRWGDPIEDDQRVLLQQDQDTVVLRAVEIGV
eukprot:COSAG06_NODE_7913_length_2335_cov_5.675431_1_plen_80_part_10